MTFVNTNNGPAIIHTPASEPSAKDILKEKLKNVSAESVVSGALKGVSSIGIGAVLGQAACMFMPPQISIPVKICVYVGTRLFGGMLMDRTDDYIDKQVTDYGKDIRAMIGGETDGEC